MSLEVATIGACYLLDHQVHVLQVHDLGEDVVPAIPVEPGVRLRATRGAEKQFQCKQTISSRWCND